jgi:hypothetical protein
MTLSTSDVTIDARRTALMLMDFQPAMLAQHRCVIAADYN